MTPQDALAAALHNEEAASNWCEPDPSECGWMPGIYTPMAARVLAALASQGWEVRQVEPSCCELACYEDPGCGCDGCRAAIKEADRG